MHIEVVNLLAENRRSDRTGIQVKSNEGEGALMVTSISGNKLALAKTHVRLIRQRHRNACSGVGSGPAPANMCQSDVSIEVSNLGWIIEAA